MSLDLQRGFPQELWRKAWEWLDHRMPAEDFKAWLGAQLTWAVRRDGEVVGVLAFDPIMWPGDKVPTDGYFTFALRRSEWGRRTMLSLRDELLGQLFASGTIQRVTGYTKESNKAAQAAALYLGCQLEGRLRGAAGDEDILIYGVTRKDFYGRTNDNN